MDLSEIVTRYDERLDTAAFADLDASPNGLQVGPESADVDRVAFAVDAVAATAEAAIEAGADLLVTHHGIVWGDIERVTGRNYGRIAPLLRNDVALYVSHLPLDSHPELGNAAGVADHLDLDGREPFGELGPETVGLRGTAPEAYSHADLRARLDALAQGDQSTQVLDFGPDEIELIGVVTGAGGDWLSEAEALGLDALVTGEGKGRLYHEAREAGVSVFLAGHYATETFGVRRLQTLADDWGLETTYVEHPTGL
ncbi:Nif3-like dinuclear metal center hexameric protein [Salinirubrum litoreum]|uniref:Nif3-like dinuclear metal center hexameric protein n=1 Tax=Salinirubrum litoreum TaxID=1126234 RepID=A0ABD5RD53_9EURY|nr:Nif3-like dinuclear metal center hexameric protein [Salinirubrum litoreum]